MKSFFVSIGCIAALLGSQSVFASTITFAYTGVVAQTPTLDPDSPFPSTVDVGTVFSGTYSFDPAAPDTAADPSASGAYHTPGGLFTLQLGGLNFAFNGTTIVTQASNSFAFYGAVADSDPSDPGAPVLTLSFVDGSGTALASNDLPLNPPDLSRFDATYALFFSATIAGDQVEVLGSVATLTSVVGEPSTVLLLAVAGLALGGARSRRPGRSARGAGR